MIDIDCDVLILGAGPAGCAAAVSLAGEGLRVVVVERVHLPRRRVGEMLPPGAAPLLHQLGIWDDFVRDAHLPSPGIVSVWADATPYEQDFLFSPYGNGWNLDRARFDALLAQAAAKSGALLLRGARVKSCLRDAEGSWQILAAQEEQSYQIDGTVLIDASGRSSWLAQRQGAIRHTLDQLVGVVAHLDRVPVEDSRLLLEATRNGWWYTAPLSGDRAVVAYMTDNDFLPRGQADLTSWWRAHLHQAPWTNERLNTAIEIEGVSVVSANTTRICPASGSDWLAVGDAAAAYDPLSSQGILKALDSGLRAANAVRRWFNKEADALARYAQSLAEDYYRYRSYHAHYYGQVKRWPGSLFWQRRQAALSRDDRLTPVEFDKQSSQSSSVLRCREGMTFGE